MNAQGSPRQLVEQFCAAAGDGPDGLRNAIRKWFRQDTVWENVGLATTTGVEEAIGLIDQLEASAGIVAVRFHLKAIACDGNKVLTERIDDMIDADGAVTHSDPVMGIFETDGDRIVAWRDYFDSAAALARAT